MKLVSLQIFVGLSMSSSERDYQEFKADISFICPFCKGRVAANKEGVLHVEPMCEKFEALAPDDFLYQARMRMSD